MVIKDSFCTFYSDFRKHQNLFQTFFQLTPRCQLFPPQGEKIDILVAICCNLASQYTTFERHYTFETKLQIPTQMSLMIHLGFLDISIRCHFIQGLFDLKRVYRNSYFLLSRNVKNNLKNSEITKAPANDFFQILDISY